jgi:hypothetical protein
VGGPKSPHYNRRSAGLQACSRSEQRAGLEPALLDKIAKLDQVKKRF